MKTPLTNKLIDFIMKQVRELGHNDFDFIYENGGGDTPDGYHDYVSELRLTEEAEAKIRAAIAKWLTNA